jgi:hypothetical protein
VTNLTIKYGTKILGSFIGHEQYIKTQLQLYLQDLRKIGELLSSYPDLQGRFILFRHSYVKKHIYLLRTIRRSLVQDFITEVEKIHRTVLASIINSNSSVISDELYNAATLPINEGGLGLHMVKEVACAAYTASSITFLQSRSAFELLAYYKLDLNGFMERFLDPLTDTWWDIRESMVELGYLKEEEESLNEIQNGIKTIQELNLKQSETLQNKFNCILQEKRKNRMEETMKDPSRLHWWKEQQNDISGRWLEVFPKINKYIFNNMQFRTAIRFRMMEPILSHIPGSKCSCSLANNNGHPTLDQYGIHLSAGCNIDGSRHLLHDMIVLELQSMCQEAGFHTKREPKNLFSQSQHRPDIAIQNTENIPSQYACDQLLLDIALPGHVSGSKSGNLYRPDNNQEARNLVGQQVKKTFDAKKSKYEGIFGKEPLGTVSSKSSNFKIVPIVIGLLGNTHKDTLKFLDTLADLSDGIFRYGKNNILTYYKRRISCCLFKNLSTNLIKRVSYCNSRFISRSLLDVEIICDSNKAY